MDSEWITEEYLPLTVYKNIPLVFKKYRGIELTEPVADDETCKKSFQKNGYALLKFKEIFVLVLDTVSIYALNTTNFVKISNIPDIKTGSKSGILNLLILFLVFHASF